MFQLTDADREGMAELLPLLQEIGENHPESSVQEMATDIRIAVATHGAVWSELSKTNAQNFAQVTSKVVWSLLLFLYFCYLDSIQCIKL